MSDAKEGATGPTGTGWPQTVLVALMLAAAQVLVILLVSVPFTGLSFSEAYFSLSGQSDSLLYARLLDEGYQDGAGFFPGYPLAARSLRDLVGVPTPVALLLVAHLACWGFWTYVLRFL